MYGYHGRAMLVDLTSQRWRWVPLGEDVLRRFVGGIGLGTFLLHDYCPPGVEPLGPDNPLIFVTSPLIGSRLTTSSKFAILTKSPLTGFIGDSLSSSFLATELKRTGCDALVLTGSCPRPTVLSVTHEGVDFLDGQDLWGLDTVETETAVKRRTDRGTRVACIGPAGENLVRYASIANDGGRQAGRSGPGAVMGSKKLKAIAFRGNIQAPAHQPQALSAVAADLARRSLGPATEKYRTVGTIGNLSVFNRLGALPSFNFRTSTFDDARRLGGEELVQSHHVTNAHCGDCTIGCEHVLATADGEARSQGRLEYESAFALGPLVGVGNPNSVLRASHLCDRLGMDTISAGATVAWAMECFERGVFSPEDTGGLELRFGNEQALLECLSLIAGRSGLGDLLADGTRMASQRTGKGSGDWAMHVKGMEMPGYEPRSLKTMALGLAVSTRGACHNRSSAYEADFSSRVDRFRADERRGGITKLGEDMSAVLDSLIWCKFLRKAFDDLYAESAQVYELITGWPMTPKELRQAGERINNLKKLFNIREGWTRADDTLPPRVLQEKLPAGVAQGVGLTQGDLDMMIESYYRARGWTQDGMIPEEKVRELELGDVVKEEALVG